MTRRLRGAVCWAAVWLALSNGVAAANSCVLAAGTYSTLASTAGHWAGTGCTGGSYVAGDGDTADLVTNACALTVGAAEIWTIGTSPATASGAYAINIGGSSSLEIAGAAIVRGDSTGTATAHVAIQVDGGGSWTFDSTQSSSPTSTYYEWVAPVEATATFEAAGSGSDCSYNGTVFAGSTCAVVTSNMTGGALPGDLNGTDPNTYAGSFVFSYAALSNLGTASRNAIDTTWNSSPATLASTYSDMSCFNCGRVNIQGNLISPGFSNVAFAAGINTQNIGEDVTYQDEGDGTTLSLKNFFFGAGISYVTMTSWNIASGMTGGASDFGTYNPASNSMAGVFFFPASAEPEVSLPFTASSDIYIVPNVASADNPHFMLAYTGAAQAITRMVCESTDDIVTDTGECYSVGENPASTQVDTVNSLLLLPSKTQKQIAEFTSIVAGTNLTLDFEHATGICFGAGTANCMQLDEGAASTQHGIVQASIMGGLTAAGGYKATSLTPSAPSNGALTTADYNAGFGTILETNAACTLCTNQGNGYAAKSPSALGPHDLDVTNGSAVPPHFVNTNFRLATWDTLGNPANASCAPWVTGTVYTYSEASPACVSVATPGIYNGLSINYRLTASHTSGAATQPDVGANWRDDWEYASVFDLRVAAVDGATYTAGGQTGLNPIQALIAWEGTGWVPTASAYRFTYPGDASAITNLGAFQMAAPATGGSIVCLGACPVVHIP